MLCGIDMNDGGHFYDECNYLNKYKLLNKLKKFSNENKIHSHMDKHQLNFGKDNYDLNRFSKEKFNAEIFVSSSTSSLYPEIKKCKFQ